MATGNPQDPWPADLRTFAISRRSPLARRQDLAQVDVARPTGLLVYLEDPVLLRAHPPPRTFFPSPRPPPTTPRAGSRTRGARRGPGGAHERTVRASRRPKRSGRASPTDAPSTIGRTAKPPGARGSYLRPRELCVGDWRYTATRPRAAASKGSKTHRRPTPRPRSGARRSRPARATCTPRPEDPASAYGRASRARESGRRPPRRH